MQIHVLESGLNAMYIVCSVSAALARDQSASLKLAEVGQD